MMKKIIMSMMAFAAIVVFGQESEKCYNVYNFSANIKRIEPVYQKINSLDNNPHHVSYTQVNDTIKGYFIAPDCCINDGCVGCGDTGRFGCDEDGTSVSYLYLYRGDEKMEKGALIKLNADEIFMNVFGKGANSSYIGTDVESKVFKKLNKSAMGMSCLFPDDMYERRIFPTSMPSTGMRTVDYNFLGYTCRDGYLEFMGFGTSETYVKQFAKAVCGEKPEDLKCIKVTSVSGAVNGLFNYGNIAICEDCEEYAITDACAYYDGIYQSPVTGTWGIKYNSKISKMCFTDIELLEAYLIKDCKRVYILDVTTY